MTDQEMRHFPVLMDPRGWREHPDCPRKVPWSLVEPHEEQAQRNHSGQSLARLAQRGGLDPRELYCVLHGFSSFSRRADFLGEREAVLYLVSICKGDSNG